MKQVYYIAGELYAMLAITLFCTGHWIGGIVAVVGAGGQWLRQILKPQWP